MARTDTLGHFLTDVADAIRGKKGTSETITASDFDTEITNLPSGGDTPTKGVILSEWDNDGYPTKVEFVGFTELPNSYFIQSSSDGPILKKVSTVIFSSNLTQIGWNCFQYSNISQFTLPNTLTTIKPNAFANCKNIVSITLPNTLTTLGGNAFYACTNLESVTLPPNITALDYSTFAYDTKFQTINLDNIQTIGNECFRGCILKKVCLASIKTVVGNSAGSSSFVNCSRLKQVWIGENVTTTGLQRYAFNNCTALEKIYINLPRATVEAMTGYAMAFCNDASKTGIIVCNDDSGFITKEEFDALVVE